MVKFAIIWLMEQQPNHGQENSLASLREKFMSNPQLIYEAGGSDEVLEAIVTRQIFQQRLLDVVSEFGIEDAGFEQLEDLLRRQTALTEQLKIEFGVYYTSAEAEQGEDSREPMALKDVLQALPVLVEQQPQPAREGAIVTRIWLCN